MNAAAETVELLREIRDELRLLHADLAQRGPVAALRSKDREAMARILPVLQENFTGTFGTWELRDCAEQADVRAANLRIVLGNRSAQELGQLFQRTSGHDFRGVRIVREGRDGNGARWRCCVTAASLSSHEDAPTLQPFKRIEGSR